MVLGALAIAETNNRSSTQTAESVIGYARAGLAPRFAEYLPDGARLEGPGYWNYAAMYDVYYLAALKSALGDDFGQSDQSGIAKGGTYRMATLDEQFQWFNFGDSALEPEMGSEMFWLAKRYHRAEYASSEKALVEREFDPKRRINLPLNFLTFAWAAEVPDPPVVSPAPLVQFGGVNEAFIHSPISDRNNWSIAIKGGKAKESPHGHADVGSFILDAEGQRWGVDLGPESYSAPGYFDERRWTYYRARTESHSVITMNAQNENLLGVGKIESAANNKAGTHLILNLDELYKESATSWRRGFYLTKNSIFIVQDEVQSQDTNLDWRFITKAQVEILGDKKTIKLSQGGQNLWMKIEGNSDLSFTEDTPAPSKVTYSINGVKAISIHLYGVKSPTSITVSFSAEKNLNPIEVIPLSQW